jgi:hypothetical protein
MEKLSVSLSAEALSTDAERLRNASCICIDVNRVWIHSKLSSMHPLMLASTQRLITANASARCRCPTCDLLRLKASQQSEGVVVTASPNEVESERFAVDASVQGLSLCTGVWRPAVASNTYQLDKDVIAEPMDISLYLSCVFPSLAVPVLRAAAHPSYGLGASLASMVDLQPKQLPHKPLNRVASRSSPDYGEAEREYEVHVSAVRLTLRLGSRSIHIICAVSNALTAWETVLATNGPTVKGAFIPRISPVSRTSSSTSPATSSSPLSRTDELPLLFRVHFKSTLPTMSLVLAYDAYPGVQLTLKATGIEYAHVSSHAQQRAAVLQPNEGSFEVGDICVQFLKVILQSFCFDLIQRNVYVATPTRTRWCRMSLRLSGQHCTWDMCAHRA